MFSFLLFAFIWCQQPSVRATGPEKMAGELSRARQNGPVMDDPIFQEEKRGYAIILECKKAIENNWIPEVYQNARAVDLRVDLEGKIDPPRGIPRNGATGFRVDLEGIARPNGQYRFNVHGELGEVELIRSSTKKILVYHSGRGFSDQILPRDENANLESFRSYALRYLGQLKNQVLIKGGYRFIYVGSGTYQGRSTDRIKIAKSGKPGKKRSHTVPLNRLWTFWQSGQYELWVDQETHLPVALFYSNPEDQIYANITVSYQSDFLPLAFQLQNNSSGFEGRTEIQLDYADDKTIRRVAFEMRTSDSQDLAFDAQLSFKSDVDPNDLRGIPPLGYQKLNQEHLKILILTPFIGTLLNLRQQGLKLKSFTF